MKKNIFFRTFVIIFFMVPLMAKIQASNCVGNKNIVNFQKAKKQFYKIWGHSGQTFYCHCVYENKKVTSCPIKLKKTGLNKIDVEHLVAASYFKRLSPESFAPCESINGKKKSRPILCKEAIIPF